MKAKPSFIWNNEPGIFYYDENFSSSICDYPFKIWNDIYYANKNSMCSHACNFIVYCENSKEILNLVHLNRLLYNNQINFIENVIVINCEKIDIDSKIPVKFFHIKKVIN